MIKTEGELHDRIDASLPRLMIAFFVLNTLVVVAMVLFHQQITERYLDDIWPVDLPGRGACRARRARGCFVRRGRAVPRVPVPRRR